MRLISLLFLLVFAGAVIIFAVQNQYQVTVTFWKWDGMISVAAIAGAAYLLGMFSGWSLLGLVRRSLRGVESQPR